ncbi:MFS transporter [Anaerovorax odorimutans]|uniref:MFS transporter n=1 Tax=Anaerovorax odorimutans TaxID=109327 RepID=A0ABT1RMX7_9FIRM|nr:MFS transporter [Anaerovorax odorimutans]MCQ4636527.1 MFS transporter [Anaerovorax odorimutans]
MLPKDSRVLKENAFHPTQLKVFFVMITLYTFYFTCNNNLGVATSHIQQDFDLNNAQFGILFTIFTLGFGLGQFFSGYLGDRYSPKMLMFIGALGAIIGNIGFGLSGSMAAFSVFWAINAVSLAMGWSPGCSILFRWIPQKRWGLFMGFFDAFAFLGGIIIYPIAGFAITYFSWRAAFFVPSAFLAIWAVIFWVHVKDTPQQAGFSVEWSESDNQEQVCLKDYWMIIKDPIIILVSLSTICSQFVRWGLVNWIIKILSTSPQQGGFGVVLITATLIASAMHWGGALFSIALGHLSDTVFKGSRWQTILLGFLVSCVSLLLIYWKGPELLELRGGILLLAALLFLAGGCVQGVQAPLFNLPGDLLGTRLGGTGVGIVNGWSYIGASFAGVTLGFVMDRFGLTSCLLLMAGISFLGALVIAIVRK